MDTVSPATTAEPSDLAASNVTRNVGVVSLVKLSVLEPPLSEPASKSMPGVAGAVLSSTSLWAKVTALNVVAVEMAATPDLASAMAAVLAIEPPVLLVKRVSIVAELAKFSVVAAVTAALTAVTMLPTTAAMACVAVVVSVGAEAARVSVVATCAAAFCVASALSSLADKGS